MIFRTDHFSKLLTLMPLQVGLILVSFLFLWRTPVFAAPPNIPPTPSGPTSGTVGQLYTYSTVGSDPDNDSVKINFSWDDGTDTWTNYQYSGSTHSASHSWSSARTYCVRARALTIDAQYSGWSSCLYVSISGGGPSPTPTSPPVASPTPTPAPNHPPNTPPVPFGPGSGNVGVSYTFSTTGSDPDNDSVKIGFNWGDGTPITWTSYKYSGSTHSASHSWSSPSTYCVRAMALTIDAKQSAWSDCAYILISSGPAPSPTPTPTASPGPDVTAPNVSVVSPANGATVANYVTIYVSATDASGIERVLFYIDGVNVATITTPTGDHFTYSWYTNSYSDGSHTIYAWARDNAGNWGASPQITVTVNNGGGPTPTPPAGQPTPTPTPPVQQTPPAAPSNLSFETVSCGSDTANIRIRWLDNSNNEDGFNIYRYQADVDSNWTRIGQVGASVDHWEGSVADATIYYLVEAYNSAGSHSSYETDGYTAYTPNCGVTPPPSPVPSATPTPQPNQAPGSPSKPTANPANPLINQNVTFSATATDPDNDRIKITFAIVKSPGGEENTVTRESPWSNSGCFSGCTLSVNHSFTSNGTYYVWAIAIDQKGEYSEHWSEILTVVIGAEAPQPTATPTPTPPAQQEPPAAPDQVSAAVSSCSGSVARVIISWRDNSNNEDYFSVWKLRDGTDSNWVFIDDRPANASTYEWPDGVAGATYYFTVGAHNSAGDSFAADPKYLTLTCAGGADNLYFDFTNAGHQTFGVRTGQGEVLNQYGSGQVLSSHICQGAIGTSISPPFTGTVNEPFLGGGVLGIWVCSEQLVRHLRSDETEIDISGGFLPPGLDINDTVDFIDGTPTVAGVYNLTLRAKKLADGVPTGDVEEAAIAITINPGAAQDNIPPVVDIKSPVSGSTYDAGSNVLVSVVAADEQTGISAVELYIDSQYYDTDNTINPTNGRYEFTWSDMAAGDHSLYAIAYDHATPEPNAKASQTITVKVVLDQQPPTVAIVEPTGGTVKGVVTVKARATDNLGVRAVELYVDGVYPGDAYTDNQPNDQGIYEIPWDSREARFAEGGHTLKVIAYDTSNNPASTSVNVTVDNKPAKPVNLSAEPYCSGSLSQVRISWVYDASIGSLDHFDVYLNDELQVSIPNNKYNTSLGPLIYLNDYSYQVAAVGPKGLETRSDPGSFQAKDCTQVSIGGTGTGVNVEIHNPNIKIVNPINNPNYETIVKRSIEEGYNPAFIVATWMAESGRGTSLGCIYVPNNLEAQLNCVFKTYKNTTSLDAFFKNHCGPGYEPICNGDLNQVYPGLWASQYNQLIPLGQDGSIQGQLKNPWACWFSNGIRQSRPIKPGDSAYAICPF